MSGTQYAIPAEMRALVMDRAGFENLRVRKVPVPRPGPGQLLARVDAAGICTSLLKLVEQGSTHNLMHGWDIEKHPIILGDEGTVTLVEIGDDLRERYKVGERFVVQPAVDAAPINHRQRYRDNAAGVVKIALSYTLSGHLAEYLLITEEVLAADCLLPLPKDDVPYGHAAIAEPISCCVSAQDRHVHVVQDAPLSERRVIRGLKPGGVVVVLGAGAMGRMHADIAISYRPRALVVADLIDSRLVLTQKLFAEGARDKGVRLHTVSAAGEAVEQLVAELTDSRGADDVIVAVGAAPAIRTAQEIAGRGAVLNLFGGLRKGQDLVPFNTGYIHYKEWNVTGTSGGSPWDIARTLDLMAGGEIEAAAHLTRIGDLDHAVEFLDMIQAQQLDGKAIVYPHRRTGEILSVPGWTAENEREYLRVGGE